MKYNPSTHHRKSIRLKGYDYSQAGLYFITICVNRRNNPLWLPFGNVINGEMILNDAGKMVENEWLKLPQRFTNIELHEYVVMPNHFHAIMEIAGATLVVAQHKTVAQNNKSGQPQLSGEHYYRGNQYCRGNHKGLPRRANQKPWVIWWVRFNPSLRSLTSVGVKQHGWKSFNNKLWQRNYWEHIIRDEQSCHRITEYIINNPKHWDVDKLNKK